MRKRTHKRENIEEHEHICPECKGLGTIDIYFLVSSAPTGKGTIITKHFEICPLCLDKGKIDWITKIKFPKGCPNGTKELIMSKQDGLWIDNDMYTFFKNNSSLNLLTKEFILKHFKE